MAPVGGILRKRTEQRPDPDDWFHRGTDLVAQDKYDEALKAFKLSAKQNPKKAACDWNLIGTYILKHGKYYEALKAFNKAIELNPENAYYWTSKSQVLEKLGRREESDVTYAKAIELGYVD